MKLDGSTVQYMLSQEFNHVASTGISRMATFDYPMLYDVSGNMNGHVVLVPNHERPSASPTMSAVLCVCLGEESAQAVRDAGCPVITVGEDVTFQHLYNVMQSIFVRNDRMEAQLRAYVATHAGFLPLLETCSKTLGLSCVLVDDQYRIVCQTAIPFPGMDPVGYAAKGDMLDTEIVDLFMASREYRYMRASHSVFTVPGSTTLLMKNIFSGEKLVATLIMRHKGTMLSARFTRFVLNYLAPFIDEMYARIGSFVPAETGRSRVRSAIRTVLSGEMQGYAQLEEALEESGHGRGSRYVVARIERGFTNEGADEGGYLSKRFESALPQSCSFIAGGRLYLLADLYDGSADDQGVFINNLPIAVRDNLSKAGVSRQFSSMRSLRAAIVQADAALEEGGRVDPMNWVYRYEEYALSWLMRRTTTGLAVLDVCHAAIPTLMRYDESHNAALLETLFEFIRCRYNATAASEALFVARSTLLNRLERITELTGIDLDDYDERFYLALSFAMLEGSDGVYSRT